MLVMLPFPSLAAFVCGGCWPSVSVRPGPHCQAARIKALTTRADPPQCHADSAKPVGTQRSHRGQNGGWLPSRVWAPGYGLPGRIREIFGGSTLSRHIRTTTVSQVLML